ncbi:hypothetical protein ACFL7M_02080 [Thermodesulfobacteriota bacterium]
MTDLTIYEYYSVPEEEFEQTLQEEARNMFASDSLVYDFRESADNFLPLSQGKGTTLISRYWAMIYSLKEFSVQLFQKYFQA